ncbi:flagellar export protein FliJ [Evansella sp. AB-rgal1]|uniref:flagellar export protein FliJ n=1 Tax=Evansella sp. AB-rgal1 TaxID=3242696 RepID=UPI00359D1006
MTFQFTLQKVLDVKEYEKNEAQVAYRDAMMNFEKVATQLYELLKQKEVLLSSYEDKLVQGLPIAFIQQTQKSLEYLQREIDRLQVQTQNARALMNERERRLTVTAVDVKKYEKMKERKLEIYLLDQREKENKFVDEISVQQYLKK